MEKGPESNNNEGGYISRESLMKETLNHWEKLEKKKKQKKETIDNLELSLAEKAVISSKVEVIIKHGVDEQNILAQLFKIQDEYSDLTDMMLVHKIDDSMKQIRAEIKNNEDDKKPSSLSEKIKNLKLVKKHILDNLSAE